jgi:hypothetical protein
MRHHQEQVTAEASACAGEDRDNNTRNVLPDRTPIPGEVLRYLHEHSHVYWLETKEAAYDVVIWSLFDLKLRIWWYKWYVFGARKNARYTVLIMCTGTLNNITPGA